MTKNEIAQKAQEAKAQAAATKAAAEAKEAAIKAYNVAMAELKVLASKPIKHTVVAYPTTETTIIRVIANGHYKKAIECTNITEAREWFKTHVKKYTGFEQYVDQLGRTVLFAIVELKSAPVAQQPKIEKISQASMF